MPQPINMKRSVTMNVEITPRHKLHGLRMVIGLWLIRVASCLCREVFDIRIFAGK